MGEQQDMFPGYREQPVFPPDDLWPGQRVRLQGFPTVTIDGIEREHLWRIWERCPERLFLLSEHTSQVMVLTPEFVEEIIVVGWGGDKQPPKQHEDRVGPAGWTGPAPPCSTSSRPDGT